jgi:hypothetical protein
MHCKIEQGSTRISRTAPVVSKMSFLKFFVKENGKEFAISDMSEPETAAIEECVVDLLPKPKGPYWFEPDTCLEDLDDAVPYGVVWCYTDNPNPKDGSLGQSRIPHPVPQELLEAVQGKTFHVVPRQLGVNPWGHSVEIVFEAPAKGGLKASDLIQLALQSQTK